MFSSFHTLGNASNKLSASFTPEFKMLSLEMKFAQVPGATGVKWASEAAEDVQVLPQHTGVLQSLRHHELISYQLWGGASTSCPLPRGRGNFRCWQLRLTFTPTFQQRCWKSNSLCLVFRWRSRAFPQEPQTSTNAYLNRSQTGLRSANSSG